MLSNRLKDEYESLLVKAEAKLKRYLLEGNKERADVSANHIKDIKSILANECEDGVYV